MFIRCLRRNAADSEDEIIELSKNPGAILLTHHKRSTIEKLYSDLLAIKTNEKT